MEDQQFGGAATARPARRRVPRWLLVLLSMMLLALCIWWVLVPQYADAVRGLGAIERINGWLVAAAVVLELLSLLAYTVLTVSLLGPERAGFATILRIDLTNLALSHVVPGGGATSSALRYRLLHRSGTSRARALSTVAIEVTGANLVLGGLFALGLLLSLTTSRAARGNYRTASFVALVSLVVIGAAVWFLTAHTERAIDLAVRLTRRLPGLDADSVSPFLAVLALQIRRLLWSPRMMVRDILLASANWILDAAALWLVLLAFGHELAPGPLLTVYAVGSILAVLPLTPGGLGIVEGVMVPALIGFGTPARTALLGVLAWRLIQFWLPIPLGGAAYLSLRAGPLRSVPLRETR